MKPYQRYIQVFTFIQRYVASNEEPPTIMEIGAYVGLRSTASVYDILIALENLGFIRRSRKWRGIEILK
jgi:SOS-response transcriptional repressor LexA